jgi:hypothetical protein
VAAFYDGVNARIASDKTSMDGLLSPRFVDHPNDAPDRDRSGFLASLSAVADELPDLRFEITNVESTGTIASVVLVALPGESTRAHAWSIELPERIEVREILRLDGSLVAERWGSDALWPSTAWTFLHALPVGAEHLRRPALQAFTLDPLDTVDLFAPDTVVLWVAAGVLRVEPGGQDASGNARSAVDSVEAGELRLVEPEKGTVRITNDGARRVVFWTASLDQLLFPTGALGHETRQAPITVRQSARVSLATELPEGGVRLELSKMTLPPGAELSVHAAAIEAVAVLEGSLQGGGTGSDVLYCFGSRARLLHERQIAAPGEGFAAPEESTVIYRVTSDGPATVLLLTVSPGQDSGAVSPKPRPR